ncbi:hypothetical protein PB1E_1849 [Leuconostoc gelidum subsp. gasicomitatum]|nr:hypothetical protein PB1E_1849 [Leuconostoc gasicomitatum]
MAVLNVRFAIIFSPSISSKSIHPRHTDRKVNSIQFIVIYCQYDHFLLKIFMLVTIKKTS